ncbi:MAG: universal stress protein [Pseudomonadota bacterium]
MSAKIVIGLDGSGSGERAVAFAKKQAKQIGTCELIAVYVIEWSPFSFQTPEENEQRHKRRVEETDAANSRIISPAVDALKADGFNARGVVKHGDVADLLNAVAVEEGADQIVVARSSDGGFASRLFGSSTANLVMTATVPVTVVG